MAKQSPKSKTLQDIFRERRMKDMKREYYFQRFNQFWTATKRLALIGLLGYGAHWGSKPENRQSVKSFLKSRSAPIEQKASDFKEGIDMIKDTFKTDEHTKAYHEQRRKNIKEYRKLGVEATIQYAESGTKEYKEAAEYYREVGIFRGGRD